VSVPLDVRYGFRRLNNSAGFTAVAVLCLALGICASVTIFSVVNGLLLRPIPGVTRQDRLVTLLSKQIPMAGVNGTFSQPLSYPAFLRYREGNHAFSDLVAYQPLPGNLVVGSEPLRVTGQVVTDNYFTTLGLHPALGRLFTPGEGRREAQPGMVVSHALWQRAFGGRRQAIGSAVNLNGFVFLVIGVTPEGFRGTVHGNEVDFWVPIETASQVLPPERGGPLNDPNHAWLFWFFGRLRPGMDLEGAQREMNLAAKRLWAGLPAAQRPPDLEVHPAFGIRAGTLGAVASPLALLSAVAGLLMLVVCANLGGLLLVKAAARQEEIGVRLALGVTRGRLVRQLLTESVALSLIGGITGFLMALWTIDALQGISLGRYFPKLSNLAIDVRVVLFTLTLSLAAGILFGLLPALWSTRRQVVPLLRRGGAANGQDRGRTRLQEILVIGQVTLSLMLLVITGLFVRTLWNLESIDPGFDSSGVLNVRMDLSLRGLPDARGLELYDQLLPQVRKLPGVRSAALASRVLLAAADGLAGVPSLRPERGAAAGKTLWSEYNVVTPGYFQTLRIPLARGRDFAESDRAGSIPVLIVDETLANSLWPGGNPIGERVVLSTGEVREVVGVARNVRVIDLQGDPKPYFYMPLAQQYRPTLALHVKTAGDPLQAAERIRATLRKLDPNLAVQVSRFDDEFGEVLAQPRLFSWLFGGYSLLAVLITAIGLYGTLSYAVSRRTRELGIRMALGARTSEIIVMVLRRGLALTLTGLALGVLVASWTTSVLSGLLFGVAPTDPVVFVSVVFLLTLVGLAASSLPAYSATQVDPMAIIRHE
jgi:predicted permease